MTLYNLLKYIFTIIWDLTDKCWHLTNQSFKNIYLHHDMTLYQPSIKIYRQDDLALTQKTLINLHHDMPLYQPTIKIYRQDDLALTQKSLINLTNRLLKYICMMIWHLTNKYLYICIMTRQFTKNKLLTIQLYQDMALNQQKTTTPSKIKLRLLTNKHLISAQ